MSYGYSSKNDIENSYIWFNKKFINMLPSICWNSWKAFLKFLALSLTVVPIFVESKSNFKYNADNNSAILSWECVPLKRIHPKIVFTLLSVSLFI